MSTGASVFSRGFWFGQVDARPLALFRVGFAGLLLIDWLEWGLDLRGLISSEGIFPHGGPMDEGRWSLFSLVDGAPWAFALWGLGILSLGALLVGWQTRVATVVSWALLVSLHNRNTLTLSGGDRAVELLLLTSLFTQLSGCWSLDARARPQALVPALGLRFMQLQVALMYLLTARLKLRGVWRSGEGIWLSLQHQGFLRPPGALLMRIPALTVVLNWLVLGLEFAFAPLAFFPVARRVTVPLAIGVALAVQAGVLATMRVGFFTVVMLWLNVLWLEPAWLDWLLRRVGRESVVAATPAPGPSQPVSTSQWAAGALLGAVMALVAWDFMIGSRVPMPAPLRAVHRAASLEQLYELFGVTYQVSQWQGQGALADGTAVEVLSKTEPGLNGQVGWLYDPWYKLTFNEAKLEPQALAGWLCRRWREQTGAPLSSLTLTRTSHAPVHLGEPTAVDEPHQVFAGPCP